MFAQKEEEALGGGAAFENTGLPCTMANRLTLLVFYKGREGSARLAR